MPGLPAERQSLMTHLISPRLCLYSDTLNSLMAAATPRSLRSPLLLAWVLGCLPLACSFLVPSYTGMSNEYTQSYASYRTRGPPLVYPALCAC